MTGGKRSEASQWVGTISLLHKTPVLYPPIHDTAQITSAGSESFDNLDPGKGIPKMMN
jgi:hypothetical protein